MEFKFKKDVNLDKRKEASLTLLNNEPKKVPIILEKDPNCKLEGIGKSRYLILRSFTVNKFISLIRQSVKIPENDALFLSAKGKYSITGETTIDEVYKKYKDKEDNFLYIMYSTQLVYG